MSRPASKVRGVFERPNGSGVWWISYFDQYGRRHREKVGARGAALEAYRKRKTEIREGRFFPEQIVRRDCPFRELATDRLEFSRINNPRSCRNDEAWMKLLLEAFGSRPVSSITAQEIEQFKDRLPLLGRKAHNPRKPATVKQYLTLLRSTLNLAIRNGKITRSPFAGVRMPKVNNSRLRYLLDEEEKGLLERSPAWLQPIIRFATLSGCRQGEILALTWADVDLEFGAVHVRRSKNGEARTVPLPASALRLIKQLPHHLREDRLFPYSGSYVSHAFAESAEQAELKDIRFHDLRHTYGARCAMSGVDSFALQRLMGHKTQAMTLRYVHLSPDYLKRQVALLDRPKAAITGVQSGTGSGTEATPSDAQVLTA